MRRLTSSEGWMTPVVINELNKILKKEYPELRKFITDRWPDLMTALINADVKKIKRLSKELRRPLGIGRITGLHEFLYFLQKIHSEAMFSMTKPSQDEMVKMPFVICQLNGIQIYGLIDTGAQHSTISRKLAENCRISYLIDERFATKAYGVGQQTVIGKIFGINIQIELAPFTINLVVIEEFHSNYFLIGQDFLIANKCTVYCNDGRIFFRDKQFFATCICT